MHFEESRVADDPSRRSRGSHQTNGIIASPTINGKLYLHMHAVREIMADYVITGRAGSVDDVKPWPVIETRSPKAFEVSFNGTVSFR